MAKKDNGFLKKLLATFKVEAEEHLKTISLGLVELEKTLPPEKQLEIVETIFRETHSLKGAARAVSMTDIESVCQALENIFAAWQRGGAIPSAGLLDSLHQTVDVLEKILSSPEAEETAEHKSKMAALIRRLQGGAREPGIRNQGTAAEQGVSTAEPQFLSSGPQPQIPTLGDTVRIPRAKLDRVLLQAEEFLSAKLTASQRAADLRQITTLVGDWEKAWAKFRRSGFGMGPVELENRQSLIRNSQSREFLEWNDHTVTSIEEKLAGISKSAELDRRMLGRMVDDLLAEMKSLSMLPISSVLEILPRFVRELSRDQEKEVDLVIQGGEIEIDRRILEEIKDPLIHLVRNCIDHGIEKPEERKQNGKRLRGTITIALSQKNGSKVELIISDDGRGVDVPKVRSAALRLGLIPDDAPALSDQEALSLIFQTGVSTSAFITDISGRGLGLAIVREKVGKLGGMVSVETKPDAGTAFQLTLPVTLATFRGTLVRVNDRVFVMPTTFVERVTRIKKKEIRTVENRETIPLDGQVLPLVQLSDALQFSRKNTTDDSRDTALLVILGSAEKRIAFLVDDLLNEQEVLVKTLGKQLSRVQHVAAATVLGTGQVVPVLNVFDLMKSAARATVASVKPPIQPEKEAKKKSILVVEDSITARTLLKNILESAGYHVAAAVDGVDGYTQLRSSEFDLVVSDVDMPRMNGFDLTAKIRSDKKFAGLPVVLVTALESREDRERGIDVGANAYIVKSSFDQSNLLEVIGRLI
ncbi:MAG: hybrid sensor histidine kinase/response regulator [Deltaproteobacteria bacterium]|nr:hybrid sensor histidine kinase/response regulator [Deltaproteobacteria bacterium]